MDKRAVTIHLMAVAALAESLAIQIENNKLWEGELGKKMSQIRSELIAAESEAEDRGR